MDQILFQCFRQFPELEIWTKYLYHSYYLNEIETTFISRLKNIVFGLVLLPRYLITPKQQEQDC